MHFMLILHLKTQEHPHLNLQSSSNAEFQLTCTRMSLLLVLNLRYKSGVPWFDLSLVLANQKFK